jgi:hypothetical protein
VEWPDKSAAEIWPILYRKDRKGAEKVQSSRKCILTALFTLILCKSKKYYTFATDIDKDNFCVSSTNALKRVKITRGPNFFLSGRIFPPSWPEISAKSWQHCNKKKLNLQEHVTDL